MRRMGRTAEIVVMEENGFLPDGISSPYGYFRTRYHREIQAEKDLSAAFLNVPEPWEICITGSRSGAEDVFIVKAYVNIPEGKVVTVESPPVTLKTWRHEIIEVSLIIPIYNAEDYIVRSMDTVLAQSFSGLEVILVDDGSTDHRPEILDWYAGRYQNITVIHQTNSGVPEARNTGIRHAGGQYIGFMDNDDMLCPDMIERLYRFITANDCDIAVTFVYQISDSGYEVFVQYPIKEDTAIPAEDFLADYYMKECDFGVVV